MMAVGQLSFILCNTFCNSQFICYTQEGTGRVVMWNLGILNSFTMEVRYPTTLLLSFIKAVKHFFLKGIASWSKRFNQQTRQVSRLRRETHGFRFGLTRSQTNLTINGGAS